MSEPTEGMPFNTEDSETTEVPVADPDAVAKADEDEARNDDDPDHRDGDVYERLG